MKQKFKILFLLFLVITSANAQVKTTKTAIEPVKPKEVIQQQTILPTSDGLFAEITTNKGVILLNLEYQKAPVTVANFISLAEGTNTAVAEKYKGKRFYDGLKFHRVIANFMIQGGDPEGNGSGGTGYAFKDEFHPTLVHDKPGILSMANSGPKTNSSQFFITHKETSWLNNKHSIFGSVVTGMDVVNTIAQDDVIVTVKIKKNGADANKFDAVKVFSNYLLEKVEDDKKQATLLEEMKKKSLEAQTKKLNTLKTVRASSIKTASGLEYIITRKGNGIKPVDGTKVGINYAGFLENGTLFDTSIENVAKEFGKFDQNRANANAYKPLDSEVGKYQFIPGFIEGLNLMSIGDKATLFIPANLAYGAQGAGNVIPPNSNIIFEIELLPNTPKK